MNGAKFTRVLKFALIGTDVIICLSGLIMLIAGSVVQGQINTQKLARTIGGYSTTSGNLKYIRLMFPFFFMWQSSN